MTFRRYSRFTSSSLTDPGLELVLRLPCWDDEAVISVGGRPGDLGDAGDATPFVASVESVRTRREPDPLAAQYPTPGFRCFSSNAADDCTLRNSSLRV